MILGFGAGIAVPNSPATEHRLWHYPSDGSWYGQTVSIGNGGTQVFTEFGLNSTQGLLFSSHDASPPAAIWEDSRTAAAWRLRTASAPHSDIHVTLRWEASGPDSSLVVCRHPSPSAPPGLGWSWAFPFVQPVPCFGEVYVCQDGQRIVAIAYDYSSMTTDLVVFDSDDGIPSLYASLPVLLPPRCAALSADGHTAALATDLEFVIYDVDSGSVLQSQYLSDTPSLNGLSISGDGSIVALGATGEVQVYERSGSQYSETFTYSRPSGSLCRAVRLSEDGSTMGCGYRVDTGPTGWLFSMVDLPSRSTITCHQRSAENDNYIRKVVISEDGSCLALGMTGGDYGQEPELVVYQKRNNEPIAEYDLPGIVNDLAISPDGTVVAVAYSGSNTSITDGGGIALFESTARDLALNGVPRVGTTVTFEQQVPPAGIARVISAPTLSPTPIHYAGVGTLHLLRGPQMAFLPPGSPGEGRVYETDYVIPNDPNLIGTSLYFQGLGLSPRGLSDNYVKMTILP